MEKTFKMEGKNIQNGWKKPVKMDGKNQSKSTEKNIQKLQKKKTCNRTMVTLAPRFSEETTSGGIKSRAFLMPIRKQKINWKKQHQTVKNELF